MRDSSTALVAQLGIGEGFKVLDLGYGDGTLSPPEGFISPMLRGVENHVTERFGSAGVASENINFLKDSFTFNTTYSPSELVNIFKNYYSPTMNAFEAAEKIGKESDLQRELEVLFNSQNQSSDNNSTLITATFLRVTVHC